MSPRSELQQRLAKLESVCHEHGLPVTKQKKAIFTELAKTFDHPSAQMLYDRLKNTHPDLSFATVYKNLRLFQRLNLAIEIELPDGPARFDANTETHHHAVNEKTGKISDVSVHGRIPLPESIAPKKIKRVSVTYYI
ncbi:MAG: Fur family transcriptional regulator [Patescibacteria group bacterium]